MKPVFIIDALRTPVGKFSGGLSSVPPAQLAVEVIKDILRRNTLSAEDIDDVILGNVLQAGQGQNCARQAQLKAGIPQEKTAQTINMVCGSGLRSITSATQAIKCGDSEIVLSGGTENMSLAPYILPKARNGYRMGDGTLVDYMIRDGLWDVFNDYHMGITAENIAKQYKISREDQDQLAVLSQNRAERAQKEKIFINEIVPIKIPQKKGKELVIDTDEHPRHGTTVESLKKLRPAFTKNGTVTAGNSSGINDGASIVLVASEDAVGKYKLEPMAKVVSYKWSGVDPAYMGLGPIPAIKGAMRIADWELSDLDLIEVNEAFAAQTIAVMRELNLDLDKLNVNGGAIALGHPIGASGARIVTTLLHEMKRRGVKKGLAALCIGGGMGIALCVEAC